MLVIKKALRRKMDDCGVRSDAELSRMSGVPVDTIRSIKHGNSKNPGYLTLKAVADVLCCDIEDLIDDKSAIPNVKRANISRIDEERLFANTIDFVEGYLKKNSISEKKNVEHIRRVCVNAIHRYAIEKAVKNNASPQIDPLYAEWFIDRELDNIRN